MAEWKVIRDKIQLFPHPNADALQLGKVGPYQVVVQIGLYTDGDEVVFAPEKSVLPESLAEPFRNYLRGKNSDRVGSVRLRGELSMGVIIPVEKATEVSSDLPFGVCLSTQLGISKYEPPIPQSLSGEVMPSPDVYLSQHDVEQFGIYASEFTQDESVIVTEKIHGSQVMYYLTPGGEFGLSSKGILSRGLVIVEGDGNLYWRAARNCLIEELMCEFREVTNSRESKSGTIQFFGEVIPVQGGKWTYGIDPNRPEVRLFDIRVNGDSVNVTSIDGELGEKLRSLWVPVVSTGQYTEMNFPELCKGNELVSGEGVHIREGVVVRPSVDRCASDGTRLMVKVINPKYAKKETGEEIS